MQGPSWPLTSSKQVQVSVREASSTAVLKVKLHRRSAQFEFSH